MDKIKIAPDYQQSIAEYLNKPMFVAFTHRVTKSGHKIMIYERHSSRRVAYKRLVSLLERN